MDPKVSTLRLISENKNILFASNKISEEIRKIKWDEIAQYAKLVGILKENENGKYMRTVKWKNWRKRVVVSEDKIQIVNKCINNFRFLIINF